MNIISSQLEFTRINLFMIYKEVNELLIIIVVVDDELSSSNCYR